MPFELPEESQAAPIQSRKPPQLSRIRTRYDALKWGDAWEAYAHELESRVALLELLLSSEKFARDLDKAVVV